MRPAPPPADNPGMGIRELTPAEAFARVQAGAILVDVREAYERDTGMADGADGIAQADLVANPAARLPDTGAEIILICQGGRRSQLAAEALAGQGYRHLASVVGGTSAWEAASLPMHEPRGGWARPRFATRFPRRLRRA